MNRISGAESCSAIWTPCAALVAPGPRVTKQIPGRPVRRPSVSAIIAAPASCRQTVERDRGVAQRVERGEEGFARHAIDAVDALSDELINENLSAGAGRRKGHGGNRSSGADARRAGDLTRRTGATATPAGLICAESAAPRRLASGASCRHCAAAMALPLTAVAEASALANLNARSREIFRRIVKSYLSTGEPVGSRHLSRLLPMSLSPASVRNVMQDLEELGLIYAPARQRRAAADPARPALLRRRAARIRRSRPRGAGAHRQPGCAPRPRAAVSRARWPRRRACSPISPAAPASC